MFGLNLWARPFLPPPGGPSGPGMEGLAHMARPPTSLGSPPYLVPGLMDKSGPMIPPSSLLLYRPGEHLLHPSMLRLDHPNLPAMHAPAPERSSLHPPGLHNDDEPYPSAFVPAKRARIERPPGLTDDRRTPESRHAGSPMADGRCGSTGGSADNASPALSARSPLSGGRPSPELHGHTDGRSPSPLDPAHPRCPVCTLHLNWDDIENHLAAELERLRELCGLSPSHRQVDTYMGQKVPEGDRPDLTPSHLSCRIMTSTGHHTISTSRYETFLKIRGNRQARLNAKYRPRRKRPSDVELTGRESEEMPRMREPCLGLPVHALISPSAKSTTGSEGQSTGEHDTSLRSEEDEKEPEIDVTTPDPATSGAVDLRLASSPLPTTAHPPSPAVPPRTNSSPTAATAADAVTVTVNGSSGGNDTGPLSALPPNHPAAVNNHHLRCHVCNNAYSKPVTSLQCWHVHCEGCWLQALSSKQLCPQCNIVTSPSELRQVFI